MSSQNRTFFALAAAFVLFAGHAPAEEQGKDEQKRPHFFQPGSGYEQEPEYKFTGVISKLPEKGMAGVWIIDSRPILVTPLTVIKEENGKIAPGITVDVKGVLKGMDFMATAIEVKGGGKS